MKKIIQAMMIISLTLSLLFLSNACTRKQLRTESEVMPAAKAPPVGKSVEAEEAARKEAEAEEAVKLRERETAQKLQQDVQDFESENIYFDFDKSDLKPEARAILRKKAEWLRAHPGYSVRIEGHCDERGTNEYNLALGESRALAAKHFLITLGISGQRISFISFGEERPADPGHDERAWAKNRRDEFVLME